MTMQRVKPWLYATLTKGQDARHLLIFFLNGSAETELIQVNAGVQSSIAIGTEYEMKQQAEAIAQVWMEDEKFTRLADDKFAFEPLDRTIALAIKMGFKSVYDRHFIKKEWPNPNFTGEVPLSSWPGMTAKNGGGYLYALDQMRLHARPTLPESQEPLVAPSDGKEFAAFILKHKAILDTVGPFVEFVLAGD